MKRLTTLLLVTLVALSLGASLALATDAKTPARAEVSKAAAKTELVDINTASEDQLKALPGMTPELAKKVIAGRPYANKAQLTSRKILPQAQYDKIRDQIIARQTGKGVEKAAAAKK